jgi:O-acetyl-ADP-ribose deacetylase (regulator of RNase III)
MLTYATGDILKAQCEALVNPVNCVGVMGAGLAAQFRKAFPENFKAYKYACGNGGVHIGCSFIVRIQGNEYPYYIFNFPTKQHWRDASCISDIIRGLSDLAYVVKCHGIKSVALPALGCGLGGLSWPEVKPNIEKLNEWLPDVDWQVYLPGSHENSING